MALRARITHLKTRISFVAALQVCAVLGALFGLADLARVMRPNPEYVFDAWRVAVWILQSVGLAFAVGFALVLPATLALSFLARGAWDLPRARRAAAAAWIFFHVFLVLLWQQYKSLEQELSPKRILLKALFLIVAVLAAWILSGPAAKLGAAVLRSLRGSRAVAAAAILALALAAAWWTAAPRPGRSATPGPNVLVILVDTLRADALGCYGNARPTSPRIDAFAGQGVRFENAIAESSWTIPTVASIFTGVYPHVHRVTNYESVVPDRFTTLAETFQAAGYRTGARISNILVNDAHGFLQGFEDARIVMDLRKLLFFDKLLAQARVVVHYDFSRGDEITDATIKWLHQHGRERFFLYAHYYDPHFPYEAPSAELAMRWIDPAMAKRYPYHAFTGTTLWNVVSEYKMGTRKKPEEVAYVRAAYDGEVRYLDGQIARLLDYLKSSGLDENTIVVFTADHGEQFYEHGEKLHSKTLYNEEVHVPLIVRAPGVAPRVVSRRVRTLDIYPTLVELAGLSSRAEPSASRTLARQVMGMSLVPLLKGGDLPATYLDEVYASLDIDGVKKEAYYSGPWKLIENIGRGDSQPRPPWELYHLPEDPRERIDRAPADPQTRDRLAGRRAEGEKQMAGRAGPVERKSLGKSETEKLKALGYINN